MTTAPGPSSAKSTFVTVVAWLFIVGAGFGTVMALLQAAMLTFVFPDSHFWSGGGEFHNGAERLPAIVRFMIAHMAAFFVFMWVITVTTLFSAIALLKRKNWARIYFVVLLLLGIVWSLGGLALQFSAASVFSDVSSNVPAEARARFESMATAMLIVNAIVALAIATLMGWVVKRLLSAPVRSEFGAL